MKPKRKTTRSDRPSVADTVKIIREHQTGRSEDPFLSDRRCVFCDQVKRFQFYEFTEAGKWACEDCAKERRES